MQIYLPRCRSVFRCLLLPVGRILLQKKFRPRQTEFIDTLLLIAESAQADNLQGAGVAWTERPGSDDGERLTAKEQEAYGVATRVREGAQMPEKTVSYLLFCCPYRPPPLLHPAPCPRMPAVRQTDTSSSDKMRFCCALRRDGTKSSNGSWRRRAFRCI